MSIFFYVNICDLNNLLLNRNKKQNALSKNWNYCTRWNKVHQLLCNQRLYIAPGGKQQLSLALSNCAGALRNGWPLGKCNNNSKLKASEPRTKVKKEKITATITKSVKDISQNAYLKPFPKGLINEKKNVVKSLAREWTKMTKSHWILKERVVAGKLFQKRFI